MKTPSTEPETTRALFRGLAGAALFTGGLYLALTATTTAMFLPDTPLAGAAKGAAFLTIVGGAVLATLGWRLGMPGASREDEEQGLIAPAMPSATTAPEPSPAREPERKKTFPPPAPSGEDVAWRWEGKREKPLAAAAASAEIEAPYPPLPAKRGMPWEDGAQQSQV